jgi:ABC-type branched-subunit amino acid transport system permease subunit
VKRSKIFQSLALLAFLAFLVMYPLLISPNPGTTNVGVYVLLFTGAAIAWNLFSGFTGYINLGSAMYLGIGGYAMAILCQDWNIQGGYKPFFVLPLAGLIAAVCAIPLGWLVLRLRRYAFMVLTIAIFYIGQYLAYNLGGLTNGASGIFLPNPPWDAYFFDIPFYYIALAILLLALASSWWIRSSKYGLSLLAIRDDEDRALSLGVKTGRYKLSAYVLSSFFIGMIGAFIVYYVGSIYPEQGFSPSFDVVIALIVFLGGVGTIWGPLVGGLLIVPLQQFLILQYGTTPLEPVMYGGLLLVVILLLPEGIVPSLRKLWQSWRVKQSEKAAASLSNTTKPDPTLVAESGRGGKG